ncbi:MAG: hypothetical protein V7641_1988 [Blastocatellia bacterium]
MAEIASQINPPTRAPTKSAALAKPVRTYPFSQAAPAAATPFNAILLLVVLSLLGGVLAMLARGGLERWQSLAGSAEGLISFIFLAQVAAAVLCFAFLIRWMRS